MSGAEMEALIQRVEKAQGPDASIDADIAVATGWKRGQVIACFTPEDARIRFPDDHNGFCRAYDVPRYTASLDAAVSLVPEGHWWNVSRTCADNSPMRHFGTRSGHCFTAGCAPWGRDQHTTAHTPELALLVAILKALLAGEEGK